ncbi:MULTISPECIES: hypothetical protein [Streptomycetaceae]|uniref:Secreted protein n=1 Tax=Streptantibioticus cattleyicolor (strain ATCC 35852 / DSM 46488 / JCM 4925 / NBRC 14057 / NRRL 8057) TaxID=1003195 RepID=F8JUB2_STREN|nr:MULTISPECIES: hypothetical protein [Streptomycetaceae]AEW94321.1 secreted protein [Streptantibioticus cattleyicolor NRRL 8057 = DSM 46488]MYS58976.1 hypothetical protein [Streptomyces sp. SID5468]CCB74678.1 Secreted protein [Streptantibioticus cattleyicolor NRRL 8057 = DSM 46488]
MPYVSSRARILAACSALVVALLAVAASAPLPMTIAQPGDTADVLGRYQSTQVITVSGAATRGTAGQLRMVTIKATGPDASVHLLDVVEGWFRTDRAVMPTDAVYPGNGSPQQIARQNADEMKQSQDAATTAALRYLRLSPARVNVKLRLADVGGPSAGLMFTLGIIDKIRGDGHGGDLTGGRVIAGTGTIDASGAVGAVGGVALKEQAAKRDGATVFLAPRDECTDAKASLPAGLTLVPVADLGGALDALDALSTGRPLPSC